MTDTGPILDVPGMRCTVGQPQWPNCSLPGEIDCPLRQRHQVKIKIIEAVDKLGNVHQTDRSIDADPLQVAAKWMHYTFKTLCCKAGTQNLTADHPWSCILLSFN